MKRSVKLIAFLCLLALLLQGCGKKQTSDSPDIGTNSEDAANSKLLKQVTLTDEELYDKIVGGWIGQMVGVAWAASTEFCYAGELMPSSSMPAWKASMINDAFGQDDLYVEIPFMDAMKTNGVNCKTELIARKFRDSKFALWHANNMARENLRNGIDYPYSGSYINNYHADDIDWQIECDFLGMMYPGMVNEAAERAFELGHIMNYGDGVYGGVFITAMHSAAFTAESVEDICLAGISVIPEGTEFRKLVDDVMESYKAGDSFEDNWNKLEDKWAPYDLCPELPGKSNIDAKLNSAYVLLGLLYGEGDLSKTILISTRCGQDSDCNPSSAASILGNFYGASKLPDTYKEGLKYEGVRFSNTSYTFNDTVDLNFNLMKDELEKIEKNKNSDGVWTFNRSTVYTPVKFEQWPDGVYAYLNIKVIKNTVSFAELTTYSKNEEIKGYKIDMGDGFSFNNVTPAAYTYKKAGDYTITVKINGTKGSVAEVNKNVTVKADLNVETEPSIIICNITAPAGGGSKDIGIICDGVVPDHASANDKMQYDTYTLCDPHGNPEKTTYIGYLYKTPRTVSKIIFTEGNHFGNGGWFKNGMPSVELLVEGEWVAVNCTVSPEYPKGDEQSAFGKSYETYTFTLDSSMECNGVRLIGYAGGSASFISVSELEIK